MTPLFIPLKREYFEAFKAGTKTEEFRPYGRRWNERTCPVGRAVTLSLGYGKSHRMTGVVTGFVASTTPSDTAAWVACYGPGQRMVACIRIRLDPPSTGAKVCS
ncbi:hypothetical protein [Geothrix campi]|uniref:hypothetical protein n=1 Tax=Geothrix campi TaxID=2966450 RepID=UPI0021483B0D|nr:hypothetical protein [Geothrix sp. SG10]